MAPSLVYVYGDKRVIAAGSGTDAVRYIKTLDSFSLEAEEKLGVAPGTYDFFDRYGKIEAPEDLQRALHLAGSGECLIEVREREQYVRIRELQQRCDSMEVRVSQAELGVRNVAKDADAKLEAVQDAMKAMVARIESRIAGEVMPVLENLCRDRNELRKDCTKLGEKLALFNVKDLEEMAAVTHSIKEEFERAVARVGQLDTVWSNDKARLVEDNATMQQEMRELQRYLQGKIDVCIEADADLRREQQLSIERMQLVADDLRLLTEDHQRLARQCTGTAEEGEDLRTLLGKVREDSEHLRGDFAMVLARVHCIEGIASEKWEGFAPGVLYFRQWHRQAKGSDVQLSNDLHVATGRGFLAASGVVLGSDEGLAIGDGPCRRWGTPGQFSSYYEIEVEEVCAAPAGAGGLYVGVCLQSGEEVAMNPRHEFDGWLIGGASKALICRAGTADVPKLPPGVLPATLAPGGHLSVESPDDSLMLLRMALPPRPRGEVREVESVWASQMLRVGDRVGVLFRCNRDGGARLRVSVNAKVVATHEFLEAPPAEAVGFLTPVIRLAGTGKSVRLLPGLQPPARMLAD